MIYFTILGRPITKKNHCQIITNPKTHRPMLIQSKQYRDYEKDFIKQLDKNLKGTFDKEARLHLRAFYYFPDRRGKADLVNLIQATQDIMQKAGIYADDSQIVSLDGSRICGIDKENPRAEIFIEELNELQNHKEYEDFSIVVPISPEILEDNKEYMELMDKAFKEKEKRNREYEKMMLKKASD